MNDIQALKLVITVSSIVIFLEAVALIFLIVRLFNKVPRPSRVPFAVTGFVALGTALFALATLSGVMPIVASAETIIIVRSIIMLLMGLPIWVILAMYDARCIDCPLGRLPPK